MSRRGDVAIGVPDDPVEEALSDHHLDEVIEMIEQAEADARSDDRPFTTRPPGSRPGS